MRFVAARVGIEIATLSSSTTITSHSPAFTIHPQEKGTSAIQRLLAMVPDVLFFMGHTGYIKNPQTADSTDYSYGTDHAVLEGNYVSRAQGFNRVQVYGDGVLAEAFSWGEVDLVHDRLLQIHDLNLDTATKAQDRSDATLRKQLLAATEGQISVPTNCGQEAVRRH